MLPAYAPPRNEWQHRVNAAVLEEQTFRGVGYRDIARLDMRVTLYLGARALDVHETDERVKDIVDALEGRIAGRRSRRRIAPIVQGGQILHIILEKDGRVPRGRPLGLLSIARYRRR